MCETVEALQGFWADRATMTEGGSTSCDQRSSTYRIMVKAHRDGFRSKELQIVSIFLVSLPCWGDSITGRYGGDLWSV